MGFGWLGTFRAGQWNAYRSFILKERADATSRLAVIEAEINRIGQVTVEYQFVADGSGTCSEERVGFSVSQGSSLEKLILAYTVAGGNPFDISMFLVPDSVSLTNDDDPASIVQTQPYGGVVAPKTGDPAVGATFYEGGHLNILKYTPARTNNQDAHDSNMASSIYRSRKWVAQVIDERTHALESRIIKLCDLREQLEQERELIESTIGGTVDGFPSLDPDIYDIDATLARIISKVDSIFYTVDSGGYVVRIPNEDALGRNQNLMTDILPDEDNTIL
ncbi:MAG: hypothetical protein EBT79_04275 [Actinobacteria bacterium]|nr:hypothetical protein [Actinomycetota bacterium]NBR66493.1 hypothetical protein [Actinomycetota bacterium]